MKVKIAFDWDRITQRELGVELDIPEDIVRSIIIGYLMQLDYACLLYTSDAADE